MFKNSKLIYLLLFLITSCASILNSDYQEINIQKEKGIKLISVENTAMDITANENIYTVRRSNQPIKIKINVDSLEKEIQLKPHYSFAYWMNIYTNYGLGLLVDMNNIKKYAYAKNTYIYKKDSSICVGEMKSTKKGMVDLSIGLNAINFFRSKNTEGKYSNNSGILGLDLGADFYYKKNAYISTHIGIGADGDPVERFGTYVDERATSVYTNIRNNHVIGRFELGYGINLSKSYWSRDSIDSVPHLHDVNNNYGLGCSFSTQYKFGNYFSMGVLYQPNFWNMTANKFNYQYFIAISLIWKIPVK